MFDIGAVVNTRTPARLPERSFPRLVDPPPIPAAEPRPLVLEMEGVSKLFSTPGAAEVAAVSDVSLAIEANSTVLVTGPSGSGKTTILSVIGCMMRPTQGRVRVDGREVTRMSEEGLAEVRRRTFGFVFQRSHLIARASAVRNVMVPGLPLPEVNGHLERRARELLERFGLGNRADVRVEHLSGGEQQRVAVARALINEPEIIIADEPTAHLDSTAACTFLQVVGEFRAEGKTVVVASHDPVLCGSGIFSTVFRLRDGTLLDEARRQ